MGVQKSSILTAADFFDSDKSLKVCLADAESNVKTEWEQDFIEDMGDRYDKWGFSMFMTDSQASRLKKLAEWE